MGHIQPAAANVAPELTPDQFERIACKVGALTGIVLKPHKIIMVQSRIARRLRDLGVSDFDVYMDMLDGPEGPAEVTAFCNAITTNLTSFFREPHHFADLTEQLRRRGRADDGRLRIWSAGCSTGEEPYSIAMIVKAEHQNLADKKVLATDLDTDVLDHARAGCYPIARADAIGPEHRKRYSIGYGGDTFTFDDDVRELITFNQLNLLHGWPFQGQFDFIFCRNVLIYFDAQTKAKLLNRFADALMPGGTLYLGHSETVLDAHPALEPEGQTTYRKRPC